MGESVIVSDSLALNTSLNSHVGTWWLETVNVGTEWDPDLFTKILNDCRERLQLTLNKARPGHCLPKSRHVTWAGLTKGWMQGAIEWMPPPVDN